MRQFPYWKLRHNASPFFILAAISWALTFLGVTVGGGCVRVGGVRDRLRLLPSLTGGGFFTREDPTGPQLSAFTNALEWDLANRFQELHNELVTLRAFTGNLTAA